VTTELTDRALSACAFPGARIMVVDDDASNIRLLERLLRRVGYQAVVGTTDPTVAEDTYMRFNPDLLLLDLHMPQLGGFGLLSRLHAKFQNELVPVLVVTGDPSKESMQRALSSGAKDFVEKPFEAVEILLRIENLLETHFARRLLREQNQTLEKRVLERTEELANAELATLQLLARAAEFRDDATGRHTQRVGALSALLAETLGYPAGEVQLLRLAAPLHDIGKIGIPDQVLLKPGPLSVEERAMMERHTIIGGDILSRIEFPVLRAAREIALAHHEHWDGNGYPYGLRGAETPPLARIVAVADVFDALRNERPYRPSMPLHTVIAMITEYAGAHLDPEVVDAFSFLANQGALVMPPGA
jgi:putative two-component system response regulator